MTWTIVLVLALGTFALRAAGVFLGRSVAGNAASPLSRATALLPAALIAALVALQTFSAGGALAVDARAIGVAAAAVALWLRAPFAIVMLVAAAGAALARALG